MGTGGRLYLDVNRDPATVHETQEKEKMKKYLEPSLVQRRHVSPFVASTDGLLGKESKVVLPILSLLLATKWDTTYSEVSGFVNARNSVAIVRATSSKKKLYSILKVADERANHQMKHPQHYMSIFLDA